MGLTLYLRNVDTSFLTIAGPESREEEQAAENNRTRQEGKFEEEVDRRAVGGQDGRCRGKSSF